jgi:hypothetical protein
MLGRRSIRVAFDYVRCGNNRRCWAPRATAQSGDTQGATRAYAQFSQQRRQSAAQAPELRESRDYSKQFAAR